MFKRIPVYQKKLVYQSTKIADVKASICKSISFKLELFPDFKETRREARPDDKKKKKKC